MDDNNTPSANSTTTTIVIWAVVAVVVAHCVGGIALCCCLKRRRERRAARPPVISLPIPEPGQQDALVVEGTPSEAESILARAHTPESQTVHPIVVPSTPALPAQLPSHAVNRTQDREVARYAGHPFKPAVVEHMDADPSPILQSSADVRLDGHSWNQDLEMSVSANHPPGAPAFGGDTADMDVSAEDREPPPYTRRVPRRVAPRVKEVYRYTEGASESDSDSLLLIST